MISHDLRSALSLLVLSVLLGSSPVAADEASKEACIDAHSRGQDAREQGKLSAARTLFLSCAQAHCPVLVQNDCARYADELDRLQPWLSFAARDGQGNDLPDTAVYVDEQLLLTRLDDGKAHAIDPGRHVVRFAHAGRVETITLVVGSGEKGRTVVATFAALLAPSASVLAASAEQQPGSAPAPRARSARALIIGGAVLAGAGTALGISALARVPSSCSLSSHDCAAPPGDPTFDAAEKAVRWSNTGWTLAGVGAVAVGAGLIWFFKSSARGTSAQDKLVAPYFGRGGGGLRFSARL
jgi:hypothetical protein